MVANDANGSGGSAVVKALRATEKRNAKSLSKNKKLNNSSTKIAAKAALMANGLRLMDEVREGPAPAGTIGGSRSFGNDRRVPLLRERGFVMSLLLAFSFKLLAP